MSRRDNQAKDERKKARSLNKLARKQKIQNELQRVIIACEGTVTEKLYFQDLFDELILEHNIAKTSFIIAKHKHTNPTGVLKDLENELKKDPDFEHKWIVIDRDAPRTNESGHSLGDFNNALEQAKAKKIGVAYSNPCFELWYLLHFEYRDSGIDREDIVDKLFEINGYTKNSHGMYTLLKPFQSIAIKNANRLLENYRLQTHLPANDNPCTNVVALVEVLNNIKT